MDPVLVQGIRNLERELGKLRQRLKDVEKRSLIAEHPDIPPDQVIAKLTEGRGEPRDCPVMLCSECGAGCAHWSLSHVCPCGANHAELVAATGRGSWPWDLEPTKIL